MRCLISKNLSILKFDRFFVFMLFIIQMIIYWAAAAYYSSCKLAFIKLP